MRVAYQTCGGSERDVNEDSVFADREAGLFIVADGMGGHNAGEIAGSIAVREISKSILEGRGLGADVPMLLKESVLKAHKNILKNSTRYPDQRDMGTTAVVAIIHGDRVGLCHVADSRAYLVDHDRIEPRTRDHTLVAELLEDGSISPEQARTHPARHGLTMALGIDDDVEPKARELRWENGQCLLLCSDGLTDVLDDPSIAHIIRNAKSLDSACDELITEARKRGGADDVSVIVVCR